MGTRVVKVVRLLVAEFPESSVAKKEEHNIHEQVDTCSIYCCALLVSLWSVEWVVVSCAANSSYCSWYLEFHCPDGC